ncbi:MAG: hypothetical protein Q8M02_10225 [Candidatus Didemnitutus sp.]|nr:hypothetical protein [Candidatus Didemnitutus sp.]
MALPSVTFDPTKMVVGRQSIIQITPTGGSAQPLLVEYVSHNPGVTVARAKAPGASNGPSYTSKTWITDRAEIMRFRCKEIAKVITLLGSLAGHKDGVCIAYIRDPADTSTVALITDSFACSVYRDAAEAEFSGANPSEITLVIESRKDGDITFSPAATP